MRIVYHYLFNDGYECWSHYKLKREKMRDEIRHHGKLIYEKVEFH